MRESVIADLRMDKKKVPAPLRYYRNVRQLKMTASFSMVPDSSSLKQSVVMSSFIHDSL